jgi:hypothetical protein
LCIDTSTLEIIGVALLALLTLGAIFAVGHELPPLRRYLRMRKM